MLRQLIRLNRGDFWLTLGGVGAVFLLVHLVTAGALLWTGENRSLMLSGIVLPLVSGVAILFVTVANVVVTFVQGVQLGAARRRAAGLTLGLVGVHAAGSIGLAALLTLLERKLAPVLWRGITGAQAVAVGRESAVALPQGLPPGQVLEIEDFALPWVWFLIIALLAVVTGVVIGAVVQRFGQVAVWTIWAAWMAFVVVWQLLPWKYAAIVDWLVPSLGSALAVGLVWSAWSLLHAKV